MNNKSSFLDGGLIFSWAPAAAHGHCYCCNKASEAFVTPNLNKDVNMYSASPIKMLFNGGFCKEHKNVGMVRSAEACYDTIRNHGADGCGADGANIFSYAPDGLHVNHGHCYCCKNQEQALADPNLNKDVNIYTYAKPV